MKCSHFASVEEPLHYYAQYFPCIGPLRVCVSVIASPVSDPMCDFPTRYDRRAIFRPNATDAQFFDPTRPDV